MLVMQMRVVLMLMTGVARDVVYAAAGASIVVISIAKISEASRRSF